MKNVQIDRCSLYHLPYVKCITLTFLRVCENHYLTHIPYYYEGYITVEYAHQNVFNLTEPLADDGVLQIQTVKEKRLLVLPDQLLTIHSNEKRTPLSLFELALSGSYQYIGYNIVDGFLPKTITSLLKSGPVARCGGVFCNIYLFRECYLLVLRRLTLKMKLLYLGVALKYSFFILEIYEATRQLSLIYFVPKTVSTNGLTINHVFIGKLNGIIQID